MLGRMPDKVAASFSEEQLSHLVTAVGSRSWGNHSLDVRGTLRLPFVKRRFYYVLLIGKNYRSLSRKEQQISLLMATALAGGLAIFSTLFGLLVLYLLKSALGIDLIDGFSLGIWDWFKGLWR